VALAAWGATPGERVRYEVSGEEGEWWRMAARDTLSCRRLSYEWHFAPVKSRSGMGGTLDEAGGCEVLLNFEVHHASLP